MKYLNLIKRCGPGLLFAGAAIGVSHLVQSTRAGAGFGLGMAIPVLLVLIVKFPSFAVGSLYSAQTGDSLLRAYRKMHPIYLWIFAISTFIPFFIVLAAVAVVTAGLFLAVTGLEISILSVSAGCLILCFIIINGGGFKWLDRFMKLIFVLMTVTTFVATLVALSQLQFNFDLFFPKNLWNKSSFIFLMALIGFMPAPVDISVLSSFWTLEKQKHGTFKFDEAWFDFKLGYVVTGILAFCFMLLGASLFYGSAVALKSTPVGFSHQIIDLYAANLGMWSKPLVGICALTVMFSTTLSLADGYPRVVSGIYEEISDKKPPRTYLYASIALGIGAMFILWGWLTTLKSMVDLATTLTALVSPVLAYLNHAIYFGKKSPIPAEHKNIWLARLSVVGIFVLGSLSVTYLIL